MKRKAPVFHQWRWFAMLGMSFCLIVAWLRYSAFFSSAESAADTMPATAAALKPKIAFLFLARNRMPLDILWELFFKGAPENMYTIFIHARPGFVYDRDNTECSYFWNRQVNNSVLVDWGEANMIEAERILLTRALDDPAVSHIVLLSDSCIPLYNFDYIYDYITSSSKSFVDSFREPKGKDMRYNSRMSPMILEEQWRKGSQWFVLVRKHAEAVVADRTILSAFYKYCKRLTAHIALYALRESLASKRQPESGRKHGLNLYNRSQKDCVPDEHYVQTLLAIKGLEEEVERRPVTYTLWRASDRWHPVTYHFSDVSAQTIRDIQGHHSIKYESEGRTEWCSCNGVPRACFLFARKFSRPAAVRLLHDNETDFFAFAAPKIPIV